MARPRLQPQDHAKVARRRDSAKPLYADFGPTLAAEYLQQRHGIHVGRETLRGWMAAAGLWKPRRRKPGPAPVASAAALPGKLVQWPSDVDDCWKDAAEAVRSA